MVRKFHSVGGECVCTGLRGGGKSFDSSSLRKVIQDTDKREVSTQWVNSETIGS